MHKEISARYLVQQMAERNGYADEPIELGRQGEARGMRYSNCTANAEVKYYIIENSGHTWPGGDSLPQWIPGTTNQDIDATRLMWGFFRQHPMETDSAKK